MRSLAGTPSLIAAVAVIMISAHGTTGQQGSTALIEKISGTVFLRHDAKAKQTRLNPKSDAARRLYPGEQVRCEPGGFLRLRVSGRLREFHGPSGWFTIPQIASREPDPLQKALAEYGRRGGRDRGGETPDLIVFSPSEGSVVMPDMFIIRWVPLTSKCHASFIIEDPNGHELWRQANIKGTAGILNAIGARRAMAEYRQAQGEGPLTLIATTDTCGKETKLSFTLLAASNDRPVKRDLAFWDHGRGDLIRHLGRAAVFVGYGMFPEAAEEYEAALAKAPQSSELLMRTIVAQRLVRNSARAEELSKRLPEATQVR